MTTRQARKCQCPASKTEECKIINWRRVRLSTYNRWWLRCLCCGAEWTSDARYVDSLQEE